MLPALQWVALQYDYARMWSRAESILMGPPARRASDVAEGLGVIGMMRMGRGQAAEALVALVRRHVFERGLAVAGRNRFRRIVRSSG